MKQVGTWINGWMQQVGHDTVLRHDSAPILDMPSLCCLEEFGYFVQITKHLSRCVVVTLGSLLTVSLDSRKQNDLSDRLHVYDDFKYWVRATVTGPRLRTTRDKCSFIKNHFNDVYAVHSLLQLAIFILVPECWRTYASSPLLFVQILMVLGYYSDFMMHPWGPAIISCILLSEFCVCALVSFLLSLLVGSTAS